MAILKKTPKQMILPERSLRSGPLCPFLGLSDDPGTALSYPSSSNFCHHAQPVGSVGRGYQSNYCLTPNYDACPVYSKKILEPLPKEIEAAVTEPGDNKKWIILIAAITGMIILALMVAYVSSALSKNLPSKQALATTQSILTQVSTISNLEIIESQTRTPNPTANEILEPSLVLPTQTPIPVHTLEMPIGVDPSFVIHRIQAGENFVRYAEEFGSTREAILAVNYEMVPALWAGSILIIPVGVSDASGLPSFTAYQVPDLNMTVEVLALNEGINIDALKQYNALPNGYTFTPGEWVLIPH